MIRMREVSTRAARWTTRRWVAVAAVFGVSSAGALGVLATGLARPGWVLPAAAAGGLLGAAAAAGGVFVVYSHLREREETHQLRALVNVRPLTRSMPLDLGGWAADPAFADAVVRRLVVRRPRRVVECGSGWTTVLVAACLQQLGSGRVLALEHDGAYATRTRSLLETAGVDERASVITAPLERYAFDGTERLWYSLESFPSTDETIDFLVVDGPPKSVGPAARYPAVPLLRERLAEELTVLLDDGFRESEGRIAREWGRLLGVDPELDPRGRGIWSLESGTGSGESRRREDEKGAEGTEVGS